MNTNTSTNTRNSTRGSGLVSAIVDLFTDENTSEATPQVATAQDLAQNVAQGLGFNSFEEFKAPSNTLTNIFFAGETPKLGDVFANLDRFYGSKGDMLSDTERVYHTPKGSVKVTAYLSPDGLQIAKIPLNKAELGVPYS